MKANEVKNLINEVLKEASQGRVVVNTENNSMVYYIKFFTEVEGKRNGEEVECPLAIIKNKEEFLTTVDGYLEVAYNHYKEYQGYYDLNDRDFDKLLLTTLFLNAGLGDFNDLTKYVSFKTEMIKNVQKLGDKTLKSFDGYTLNARIEKLKVNLEAPYKKSYYFDAGAGNTYTLPSLTYGIVGEEVYIYAVQGEKGKQQTNLAKKLDRYFRGLNKGIDDDDYIKELSPSALASITLFIKEMEKEGYKTFKINPYLPLRYEMKQKVDALKAERQGKTEEDKVKIEEFNDLIQFNITNKLGYLFPRFKHHFPHSMLEFDEEKQSITIQPNINYLSKNNIIYDILDWVK